MVRNLITEEFGAHFEGFSRISIISPPPWPPCVFISHFMNYCHEILLPFLILSLAKHITLLCLFSKSKSTYIYEALSLTARQPFCTG